MADLQQLDAYLAEWMGKPFVRPHSDCCFFVADWVEARSGINPAAHLRGTYTTATGALRQIRSYGDFETMWRVCMSVAGFVETREPSAGDVGVVLDAAGQAIAAIRLDGFWAAKAERGLLIEDCRMIVAWSLVRG